MREGMRREVMEEESTIGERRKGREGGEGRKEKISAKRLHPKFLKSVHG